MIELHPLIMLPAFTKKWNDIMAGEKLYVYRKVKRAGFIYTPQYAPDYKLNRFGNLNIIAGQKVDKQSYNYHDLYPNISNAIMGSYYITHRSYYHLVTCTANDRSLATNEKNEPQNSLSDLRGILVDDLGNLYCYDCVDMKFTAANGKAIRDKMNTITSEKNIIVFVSLRKD